MRTTVLLVVAAVAVVLVVVWPSRAVGGLHVSLREATDVEADEHTDLTGEGFVLLVAEIGNTSRQTIYGVRVAVPDHLPVDAAVADAPNRDVAHLPNSELLWPVQQLATSQVGWDAGWLDPGEQATVYLAVEAAYIREAAVRAAASGVVPVTVDLTGPVTALPASRPPTEPHDTSADAPSDRDPHAADNGDTAIAVNVYSRLLGEDSDAWDTEITVEPGAQIEHLIRFENIGEADLRDVAIGFNLPNYTAALPDSTRIINSNNPDGRLLDSDNITTGGINVGHYAPGAVGHVWFAVEVDPIGAFEQCGTYTLRTVGIARPEGMNQHINTTDMDVRVDCP